MRFVHMSDTHIRADADFDNYGHSPLRNLEAMVQEINNLPFRPDFVLHTGDIVDDRNEASYLQARSVLDKLRYPIYYVVGNHDSAEGLQRVLLRKTSGAEKYDYHFEVDGITFAVFDSSGPADPAGTLDDAQLQRLHELCQPNGLPLVVALHHQAVHLDSTWLDEGWRHLRMPLDCADEFLAALAPARDRLKGVFFGHVHRSFQVFRNGTLFSSAASAFGQLQSWPGQPEPLASPHELGSYNVVTITHDETIVRQHTFARPQ